MTAQPAGPLAGPIITINNIVTHRRPDGDELFAIWLLKAFADKAEALYPGVGKASITEFTEDTLPVGMTEKNFPHMLFIGCGKGELDEHPRKDLDQCAATRVATKLGIRREPALARLIKMTLDEDRGCSKVQNSFGDALKLVSRHLIDDPQKAFEWAMVAYNAIYAHDRELSRKNQLDSDRQMTVFQVKNSIAVNVGVAVADRWMKVYNDAGAARERMKREAREIWDNTRVYDYMLSNGTPVTLAVVHSDNDQLNYIGWSQRGIGIFIQKTKRGNVQIFTKQDLGLCLRETARLIRTEELRLKGVSKIPHPTVLRATDTVTEVPEWHLMNTKSENKPILFNGNQLTATNVTPTSLHIDKVVFLTIEGLGLQEREMVERHVKVEDAFGRAQPIRRKPVAV